jgi:pectate lyase
MRKTEKLFIGAMLALSLNSCGVQVDVISSPVSSSSGSHPSDFSSNSSSQNSNFSSTVTSGFNFSYQAGEEFIYLSWSVLSEGKTCNVYCKESSSSDYVKIDSELVSSTSAHIIGLKAGNYDVKVAEVVNGAEDAYGEAKAISVSSSDRSGYAFFKATEGIGAYQADGTLKSNAKVIYVNDANKNTVTLGSYKGLTNILQNQSKIGTPIDIRILGPINTNQFNVKNDSKYSSSYTVYDHAGKDYFTNTFETTYATNLSGLTNWVKGPSSLSITSSDYTYKGVTSSGDTDSYINMLDVKNQSNITVEGIGKNALANQWGFTFSSCNSIEVKNLSFKDCPEDACSFQGGSNSNMNYSRFWLHNCTFYKGKNNWDCTAEQDKHEGDGSADLKYLKNVTFSYNHFVQDHKTGLIGSGDSAYTMNVTFHHNFYDKCSSRLPLGRRVNLHAYNNYYQGCGTCQDMRAYSYTLSEANYFSSCSYASKISSNAVIKSFNDVFESVGSKASTIVTQRTTNLTNSCKPDGTTDCSKFDTDENLFYYDASKGISKVNLLQTAEEAKATVVSSAGVFVF